MLLTPIEAFELYDYLVKENLLTTEFIQKLEACAKEYRLEAKYKGSRSYLRKTYTCPFFGFKELGCPLPREVKPYGCLAFDSHHPTEKAGAHCYSEIEILEKREALHGNSEIELNRNVSERFKLLWEKAPIPVALLELIAADRAPG